MTHSLTGTDIIVPEHLLQMLQVGEFNRAIEHMPYFNLLNLSAEQVEEELILTMGFGEHLIGNPLLPALHGGTIAAMLEATGLLTILTTSDGALPKTINQTIHFLSTGHPKNLHASAQVVKQGRRIAVVDAVAWQDEKRVPIATMRVQYKLS